MIGLAEIWEIRRGLLFKVNRKRNSKRIRGEILDEPFTAREFLKWQNICKNIIVRVMWSS